MKPTLRASQFGRYAACPGSVNAERDLPDPAEESPDSIRGTRIHDWLAAKALNNDLPDLPEDDIETAEHLWRKCGLPDSTVKGLMVERQLYGFGCLISGRPDLIYPSPFGNPLDIHIDDYKTGFWTRRESADNAQLRVYAVLVGEGYRQIGLDEPPCHITVRLLTPDKRVNTPTVYTRADIMAASIEISEIYDACADPNAKRFAGPHCRYCKACGHTERCPESCNLPAIVSGMLTELSAEQAVARLPAEKLVNLWQMKKPVKRVFDMIDAEIKSRLAADPEGVPGLQLRNTGSTRQVTDTLEAYKRLDSISEEAFWRACKVSVGDLEDEYRSAHGCGKKEAATAIREALEGILEAKAKSPTIEES